MGKTHKLRNALAITGLLLFFLLVGNLPGTYWQAAPRVAVLIVRRYQPVGGSYAARLVRSSPFQALFIVSRDGRDCARVKLRSFAGFGWQEDNYKYLD